MVLKWLCPTPLFLVAGDKEKGGEDGSIEREENVEIVGENVDSQSNHENLGIAGN